MTQTEKTMEVFDEYERRFARAKIERPLYRPWIPEDKAQIIQNAKEIVRWREELIPSVRVAEEKQVPGGEGYTIRDFCYETWPHFYGVCSLYSPAEGGRRPLIFICPGHSGRLGPVYQKMAIRLVRLGAYVMILENIGQGSRKAFGHWNCEVPFACGLTLQGMILMETAAVMRWASKLPFTDEKCLGACGLSGGGTITCFLSALMPELAAIASCGYPSDFDFVLQKEKKHCCCNLLPHVSAKLEMWELYGAFAPKPLMLNQGKYDDLFPADYFMRNARKVRNVYEMAGVPDSFCWFLGEHRHPWDADSYEAISCFFGKHLALDRLKSPEVREEEIRNRDDASVTIPADAITTDETAMRITGVRVSPDTRLQDVFPPRFRGVPLKKEDITERFTHYSAGFHGDVMRILAQMEMAL